LGRRGLSPLKRAPGYGERERGERG
jgi:hypothetical protein